MAKDGGYYFLSRPRRFGKSLLVTTLEAYFQGRKELFDGLAISKLETEWKQYPVLHIDLNAAKYTESQALISILDGHLRQFEKSYGKVPEEDSVSERFKGVIKRAYEQTGQQVVILVDEYDKPLLEAIGNDELQNDYRRTLKSFYGVAKTMDSYIRFALFTGVTKFSKVSVFSDLNNLEDITMDEQYAEICGITDSAPAGPNAHPGAAPSATPAAHTGASAAAPTTSSARRIAVIHGVVDAANIGAIFRSAAALGIDAVLLSPDCCDPLNRRTVRTSMGTVFQIPWAILDGPDTIVQLHRLGFKTAAMALRDDALAPDTPELQAVERLAIILGNEGNGLPQPLIDASDYVVCIPMSHGVDSLNVAIAGAVAFYVLRK